MNWQAIFLGCFVIGFILSALSFALGALHAHLHIHVPWGHHIHGNIFDPHPTSAVGPINFPEFDNRNERYVPTTIFA